MSSLVNLSIERTVLKSILFNPAKFEDVEEILTISDFYAPFHKNLYKTIKELYETERPIDEDIIKDKLENENNFIEEDFFEILAISPIENINKYIKELTNLRIKRDILNLSGEIQKQVEDGTSVDVLKDSIESSIYDISSDNRSDFRDSKDVTLETIKYIERIRKLGNKVLTGLGTGFGELNNMTTGFNDGELIIIGARPAMGKTAFALNIALSVLNSGDGVAFFSLEMPAEQLMLRLVSSKTSIPLQNIRTGSLSNEEWSKLTKAFDELGGSYLFVDDGGSLNITQLRSKLRKLKGKHPDIKLAVIDYLQLMSGSSGKDRHLEVSEISRGLKMLARELNMPIIALSQLNRMLESRSDRRPMLSDIRESGSIEQDADIILFVYRDDVYQYKDEKEREMKAKKEGKEFKSEFKPKDEEKAEIIIGKQRNGPTGHINLIFQKKYTRFVSPHTEIIYAENADTSTNAKMEMPELNI